MFIKFKFFYMFYKDKSRFLIIYQYISIYYISTYISLVSLLYINIYHSKLIKEYIMARIQ